MRKTLLVNTEHTRLNVADALTRHWCTCMCTCGIGVCARVAADRLTRHSIRSASIQTSHRPHVPLGDQQDKREKDNVLHDRMFLSAVGTTSERKTTRCKTIHPSRQSARQVGEGQRAVELVV
eukprot:scpid30507/ scgid6338/ 